MRKKIVAGNWKMHKILPEALELARQIRQLAEGKKFNAELMVCPSALFLVPVREALGDSGISVAAQNVAAQNQGAFTGEMSADQIVSAGITHTLIGHSERRMLFGDSDEKIAIKVKKSLEAGLNPIFCCGEPIEVRQAGKEKELVGEQIEKALFSLSPEEMSKVVIAYEPVWAIGTGLTASSAQAQEMHAFIRQLVAGKFGQTIAGENPILYGGSVKSSNAAELFAMPDVDGGLVGGASLQAEEFINIVKCA
jgi:triosephosphate isomerase